MYITCPDSLSIIGETSEGIREGFIESDIVIIIYIFVYLHLKWKALTCPVNRLSIFLPLSFTPLKSPTLQTNSPSTPQLSIFAPVDLTMSNLAHTALLLDRQRPAPFGHYENLFYSFILLFWVQGFLVSGCCPSPFVTLWVLNVVPAVQTSVSQKVSDLKVSGALTFLPFSKGFLNGPLQWVSWRMASNLP